MTKNIFKLVFAPSSGRRNKAIFLDRDGVINKKPNKHKYVTKWSEFTFNPGVIELVRVANEKGYLVIITTNQRGIARGLMKLDDFKQLTISMVKEFRKAKAVINAVYYCPHDYSDQCICRKPKDGLMKEAIKDFGINPETSIALGDSVKDIEAAQLSRIGNIIKIHSDRTAKLTFNQFFKKGTPIRDRMVCRE